MWIEKIFIQKLNYLHAIPVKHPGYLAKLLEEYKNIHRLNSMKQECTTLAFYRISWINLCW